MREIIGKIGFTPDPQARGLAFRRAFLIGMIYDSPSPQYVVNMQQGILDAMRGTSFELVIRPSDRAAPAFLEDIRHFVERQKLFGVVLPPSMSETSASSACSTSSIALMCASPRCRSDPRRRWWSRMTMSAAPARRAIWPISATQGSRIFPAGEPSAPRMSAAAASATGWRRRA
ncbi:MAG: hypothetical protein WDM81_10545 [Rhizomicrobium sp.]